MPAKSGGGGARTPWAQASVRPPEAQSRVASRNPKEIRGPKAEFRIEAKVFTGMVVMVVGVVKAGQRLKTLIAAFIEGPFSIKAEIKARVPCGSI